VNQTGVSADELNLDTSLMNDINADSLDAVEIIMAIEDEFEIKIPDEEAEKFLTISYHLEYIFISDTAFCIGMCDTRYIDGVAICRCYRYLPHIIDDIGV
jgi:acyl carrier protein